MAHLTLSPGNATIADRLLGRGLGIDAVLIAAGVAITAIGAQVTIAIWPVPVTAQSIAVLVVGMTLGAVRAAVAMLVYTLCGAFGLPVFSNGSSGLETILGPTGGYILAFIAVATVVGWLAQRGLDRTFVRSIGSAMMGTILLYVGGLPWLAVVHQIDLEQVLAAGLFPFILWDAAKILLVAVTNTLAWSGIQHLDDRELERVRSQF